MRETENAKAQRKYTVAISVERAKSIKAIAKTIGSLLSIAAAYWIVDELIASWHAMPRIDWDFSTVVASVVVAGGTIIATVVAGCAYQQLARAVGGPKEHPGCSIYIVSQVLKYLPGNIFHLVGRIGLSVKAGLTKWQASLALALEISLMVFFSVAIGISTGIAGQASLKGMGGGSLMDLGLPGAFLIFFAALAVVAVVCLTPHALRFFFNYFGRKKPTGVNFALRSQEFFCAAVCYCAYFLILGLSFWLCSETLLNLDGGRWLVFVGVFSFSWVLGMITPGAPGGLGIRETVIILGLASEIGKTNAVALSLVFRMFSIIADLVSGFWAYLWWKHKKLSIQSNVPLEDSLVSVDSEEHSCDV